MIIDPCKTVNAPSPEKMMIALLAGLCGNYWGDLAKLAPKRRSKKVEAFKPHEPNKRYFLVRYEFVSWIFGFGTYLYQAVDFKTCRYLVCLKDLYLSIGWIRILSQWLDKMNF